MIARNENALECDFAETYRIYDYRELPVKRAALFAAGLSEDSRIKRLLSGQKHTMETLLLSNIADSLQWLVWSKTKGAKNGTGKPKSILQTIMADNERQYMAFDSPEAYEAARKKLIKG